MKQILAEFRSGGPFITFVVAYSVFTDLFLYGVIVPVVPSTLVDRLGVPERDRQRWVSILLAVYAAGLLVGSPIFGYIADRTRSRRHPLLAGLLALVGATAMLTAGKTVGLWVAGRLLQGISASVVWTVALALLVDSVHKDRVGESLGYVGIGMSVGILLGPTLGGVIYNAGGFYAVFGTAFGFIALDIILRFLIIEKRHLRREDSAAETGENAQEMRTASPGSVAELDSSNDPEAPQSTSRHSAVIILLTSSRFLAVALGYLAQAVLLSAFDTTLPIFVHTQFGWSTTGEGLVFLPLIVPSVLGPLVGMIIDRYKESPRFLASIAFLIAVPFYVLLRLIDGSSIRQEVFLCALLTLIGLTLVMSLPPFMAEISNIIDAKEAKKPGLFGDRSALAQGYGLLNCAYAGGSLIGPFWAGFIRDRFGWDTMTWTLALLSGLTSIPLFAFIGGWIGRGELCRRRRVEA